MRLLFVCSEIQWSGTIRAFATAGMGLAERGHQVTVMTESAVRARALSMAQAEQSSSRALQFHVIPESMRGFWLRAMWRMRDVLKQSVPRVVFVHSQRDHLLVACASRLLMRVSVVRRVPAGDRVNLTLATRLATRLVSTVFMFTSDADAGQSMIPRRAVGKEVVKLGVSLPEPLAPQSAGSTVQYIVCLHGRASRNRTAAAIRTIAMLSSRHPSLRLLVLGNDTHAADLKMQAASLRSLNLVEFLGEEVDPSPILRRAWLGWVTQEGDSAAYGMLDLMRHGIPVLVTQNQLAEQYVLPGAIGHLLPANDDVYRTSALVADAWTRAEGREAMGEAARARVAREFTFQGMVDGFERVVVLATGRETTRTQKSTAQEAA